MRIKRHVRNDVEKEECEFFFKHFLGDILFPFLKIVQKEGCMHTLLEDLRWAWNGKRISIVDPYSF